MEAKNRKEGCYEESRNRKTIFLPKSKTNLKLERKLLEILEKYKVHTTRNKLNKTITEFLDTVKQKLAVFSTRWRRYSKYDNRKQQNNQYYNNEKVL